MVFYYVIGTVFVVWAVSVTAAGLTREGFPSSLKLGRAMIGVSALLILGTLIALLATTHKEHPRSAAKAEAAEKAQAQGGEKPQGGAPATQKKGGGTVKVLEKEYSLKLESPNTLKAGSYTFAVSNVGKIQHDLAIEGGSVKEKKTPLIDAGKSAQLKVDLKPGKYKFYCSVPGHEQLGMKTEVTAD